MTKRLVATACFWAVSSRFDSIVISDYQRQMYCIEYITFICIGVGFTYTVICRVELHVKQMVVHDA